MRILLRYAAVAVLTLPLASQTTAQTQDNIPVLHTSARLVVVDVTVTDSHGATVHGLSKSAFHLTESGRAQVIGGFEEHSSALNVAASLLPQLQPGVFTNVVTTSSQSSPTILLLDELNTPMQAQTWMRQKLVDYLRTSPPNTRIAICVLNSRLILLQNFTTDPALLRAAIEGVHAQASSMGNADDERAMDKSELTAEAAAVIYDTNAEWTNLNEYERAEISLQSFHQLALYLAGIPGRKNLIWFSAAFPLNLLPRRGSPYSGDPRWEGEYRQTIDLLTRSRVAIYPIDARGLAVSPLAGSSRSKAATDFADVQDETRSAMFEMAEDTGGKAYVNANGLSQAVQEVVDKGSSYYTVSYTPSDANAHGEFRPIAIKLDNASGYKLAYRRGYYAEPDVTSIKSASAVVSGAAMQTASSYLAPPSTQIAFFARVLPATAAVPGVVSTNAPSGAKPDAANSRRFNIEYSADVSNFAISTTPDGVRHAHLEFIALAYDPQGRILRSDIKPVSIAWTPEQFTSAQQHGVRYQQQISVPAGGSATVRLFVHDLSIDHVGSLDIPAFSLKPN